MSRMLRPESSEALQDGMLNSVSGEARDGETHNQWYQRG
jgi:hypothetical protein